MRRLQQLLRSAAATKPFSASPLSSSSSSTSASTTSSPLNPGHVPTTPLTKGFVAAFSAVKALQNPHRADMVAALGDATSGPALRRLRDKMVEDAEGRAILSDRPLVTRASVSAALAEQGIIVSLDGGLSFLAREAAPADDDDDSDSDPDADSESVSSSSSSSSSTFSSSSLGVGDDVTFGEAYARFMGEHGFDPDHRDAVRFVDDDELAYVMLRYRQTHDFAHVLCGLPPTVLGELALKWFELVQTGMPMCALSALAGPLKLPPAERRLLRSTYAPWALRAGATCRRPLLAVRYEDEFATPLVDLRRRLGLSPAPPVVLTTTASTTGRDGWTPSDQAAGPVV